jgi:large subunit ribosomal protein L10
LPTAAKVETVNDLRERIGRAQSTVLAEFVSLSVAEMTSLRRRVIESGGEVKVVKNTLLGLAVKEAGVDGLDAALTGPTVVVFGYADPVSAVKAVTDFGQEHRDQWRVKAGVLEGRAISAEAVQALARVPSREALLGQLAGLFASPATRLARVVAEPIAQVGRALAAVEKARAEEAA